MNRRPGFFLFFFLFSSACGDFRSPQPFRARHGLVVSADPYASDVGLKILREGGNAVDAAVAVGFALAVVHPSAGNLGGGGFMLIHHARSQREVSLDYRETAPASAHRKMYQDEQGRLIEDLSTVGYLASGVPGSVAGLYLASEEFGSLPWSELLKPAIQLARKGFSVSKALSRSLKDHSELLSRFSESRRIFLRSGKFYQKGDLFRQPELADALDMIAQQGRKAFYQGEMAGLIAKDMKENGGNITCRDLQDYRARIREPVRGTYRDYEIVSMGPPSSGGILLIEMLNILELYPLSQWGRDSERRVHLMVEVMRRAFADRAAFLGDADSADVPVQALISKSRARRWAQSIDQSRASLSSSLLPADPGIFESDQTTHYCVVDSQGNAVAATTTLNGSYGSGVTIKGTGFLMNNEMDDFSLKPGAPNMYGLLQGEANAISPGKRPLSAMTPTLVKRGKKVQMVLGSPGGPTIINIVLQIILNVIDRGFNIQEAVNAPRFHHQWLPDEIRVEAGALEPRISQALEQKGHKIVPVDRMGDAHSILIDRESQMLLGAVDPRGNGKAAGY